MVAYGADGLTLSHRAPGSRRAPTRARCPALLLQDNSNPGERRENRRAERTALRRLRRGRGAALLRLLRRLGALARPRLVELDAPLALVGLLQGQPRPERAPAAALEPRHPLLGEAAVGQRAGAR